MSHKEISIKHGFKSVLIGGLLLSTLLTGCTTDSSSSEADGGPVKISIMSDFTIAQPPSEDNPVLLELEKRTNTDLDITWVSGPDYIDRLNVVLSSGDLPDLIKIDDVTNPVFQQLVEQGAFWDLTPYVEEYENLMNYPEVIWKNTSIDGKNFVIPVARPLDGFVTPSIRKDWLDELGLEVPQTTDELYEVLKAFKENKPDGEDPTYGYTMRADYWLQSVFTGARDKWKEVDGELVDVTLEPEMREALLYKHKLYNEGLIPPDYAVMKETQFWDLATGGRAGLTAETIEATWRWTYDQWKRESSVDWLPLTALSAPNREPYAEQFRGYIGCIAIPKSVPEEKMKKILSLVDYGASEEGGTLTLYGIEGTHYNEEDGFKVATEQAVKDSVGVGAFGKMFMKFDPYMYAYAPGMPKEKFDRNKQIIDQKEPISEPDPAIGLVSETHLKMGADYTKKIDDLKIQVIMGKQPIEAWDKYVEELKQDATYQKIIEEMNAAYKAREESY
ncbi:extracellular solute-binding protein [Litchfieldia alkalitelluris]|uniref:extracellular solute-binding protein n=1 Tax=Litchfieldia alkalitelluris TaxID=304268 RepID=UPI000997FF3A|nr:extracellular solute-binding protein [Litchfieldia alkalitelluris]